MRKLMSTSSSVSACDVKQKESDSMHMTFKGGTFKHCSVSWDSFCAVIAFSWQHNSKNWLCNYHNLDVFEQEMLDLHAPLVLSKSQGSEVNSYTDGIRKKHHGILITQDLAMQYRSIV